MQENTNVNKCIQYENVILTSHSVNCILEQTRTHIIQRINHFSIHPNDREDICQEILLKIFLALNCFDFERNIPLEHYINRIIKHAKCDYIRGKVKRLKRQESLVREHIVKYSTPTASSKLELDLITKDSISMLHKRLADCTTLERKIMQLAFRDYKPKEIAHILNIEVKVVYNAIQRCKMKLKPHLQV
ncbi:sigma-70 family RNA polymerase sigma factor [Staphylococcus gallinarum]|uniref:RNA polymerase sigma factor SigS n=1 Tax=Staphylococcus gallinarum TaxID=1293 RepID=A0A418HL14_STAGA|nr:sigma-70 family RNA polymerase sigma factor [Staphylococcus gallinarum]RIL41408.1 sigma-70 family RNA polymerase sigma factor [Staphylococcus gallinarum]RIO93558.1 sigma-70 family RNA polymerase sigma factor [Staphylococcus gallinarum]